MSPVLQCITLEFAAPGHTDAMRMSAQANPFGSAKPRESVLATRTGKSEQEILAEEAKKGLNVCAKPYA